MRKLLPILFLFTCLIAVSQPYYADTAINKTITIEEATVNAPQTSTRVKLLTTPQAANLHKRFDGWFEIQPIPVKNDKWIITEQAGLALKAFMIDAVGVRPNLREKALVIWNAIKDLPIYDLADYPEMLYNTDDPESAETLEYIARFQDLNEREDID